MGSSPIGSTIVSPYIARETVMPLPGPRADISIRVPIVSQFPKKVIDLPIQPRPGEPAYGSKFARLSLNGGEWS